MPPPGLVSPLNPAGRARLRIQPQLAQIRQMKRNTLRNLMLAALAAFSFTAPAPDFSNIQFWVGSGANQAALVIDWRDGLTPESLLWGYRWNGSATGLDMLE